jgi:hypothetical protein
MEKRNTFFYFIWDGAGTFLYSNWDIRKKILNDITKDETRFTNGTSMYPYYNDSRMKREANNEKINPDTSTFIFNHFEIKASEQKNWSMYHYSPVADIFTVCSAVEGHNEKVAEIWAKSLNFEKIIPNLIVKNIINPLSGNPKKVTNEVVYVFKKWIKIYNSQFMSATKQFHEYLDEVGTSVWYAVSHYVIDKLGFDIQKTLYESLWDNMIDKDKRDDAIYSIFDSLWSYTTIKGRIDAIFQDGCVNCLQEV